MQGALEGDRVRHRGAHGALQLGRPGVEGGAMNEDRARDVEVASEAVEAVKLVHTVGHGVRERILLRIDLALASAA